MELENKEICYPDSPRVGKFLIKHEVLRDGKNRPWLQALFGLCVILDIDDHESGRGKQFVAASELFQALVEDEEIPEYRIEMSTLGMPFEEPTQQARRIDVGDFGFVAIRKIIVRVPTVMTRVDVHQVH